MIQALIFFNIETCKAISALPLEERSDLIAEHNNNMAMLVAFYTKLKK